MLLDFCSDGKSAMLKDVAQQRIPIYKIGISLKNPTKNKFWKEWGFCAWKRAGRNLSTSLNLISGSEVWCAYCVVDVDIQYIEPKVNLESIREKSLPWTVKID